MDSQQSGSASRHPSAAGRPDVAPMDRGLCCCYLLHDDVCHLAASIASFREAGPAIAFVSRTPWHGDAGDWEAAVRIAETAGAEVVLGDWASEDEHRRAALAGLIARGFFHALIPDGD